MAITQYEDDLMAEMEAERQREHRENIEDALDEYSRLEVEYIFHDPNREREELDLAAKLKEMAEDIERRWGILED